MDCETATNIQRWIQKDGLSVGQIRHDNRKGRWVGGQTDRPEDKQTGLKTDGPEDKQAGL